MTTILWLRRDLRLRDHPALGAAHEASSPVLPLFVADPALLGSAGQARTAALREALEAFDGAVDGALVVRHGTPEEVLPAVVREVGATSVHISAETTPYGRRRDARVEAALDVPLVATGSPYAVTPGRVRNGTGEPYRVFTPFSRAWREHGWRAPAPVPRGLRWRRDVDCEGMPDLPGPGGRSVDEPASTAASTAASMAASAAASDAAPDDAVGPGTERGPVAGEEAALERWHEFLDDGLASYADGRDRPDLDGTSRLSVALKYGSVHPRTLLADLARRRSAGAATFVTELAWREFYADVLFHAPASAWEDWRDDLRLDYEDPSSGPAADAFDAWRKGRTGFPFVDAGMRQLASTGWMHNRLRMVTASFLVKDLHQWWVPGARHFLDHLRDGDVASNNHGWQWVAGTGTDAAPYFRLFNPVTQGTRFDPDGDYVRRWVPELRHLAGRAAHEPWRAADGYAHGYPERIVDHAAEREEALRRYAAARSR